MADETQRKFCDLTVSRAAKTTDEVARKTGARHPIADVHRAQANALSGGFLAGGLAAAEAARASLDAVLR